MASTFDVEDEAQPTRRDFLYIATGAMAAVGAAAVAWPLIDQMNPDAAALALASIEVDIAALEPGMSLTVKWRGKPVFIRNRTEKEIDEAKSVPVSDLPDRNARNPNVAADAPATDENRAARRQGSLADPDRHLHPSRLRAARPAGPLWRLVLPVPRLGLRHRRPHPVRGRRRRTSTFRFIRSSPIRN